MKTAEEWITHGQRLTAELVLAVQEDALETAAQQAERVLNSDGAMIAKWIRALLPWLNLASAKEKANALEKSPR